MMISLSDAAWRKASRSHGTTGGCVEVAANLPGVIAVRDSKRPEAGAHVVARPAFAVFLADAKAGRYDPPVLIERTVLRSRDGDPNLCFTDL